MSVLGNIIWLVFGGFFMALEYLVSGFLLCCTIIGIPFGLQVFKIGLVALLPFSQTTVVEEGSRSCLEIIMNVIWFFIGGIWIALSHLGWGSKVESETCFLFRLFVVSSVCKESQIRCFLWI